MREGKEVTACATASARRHCPSAGWSQGKSQLGCDCDSWDSGCGCGDDDCYGYRDSKLSEVTMNPVAFGAVAIVEQAAGTREELSEQILTNALNSLFPLCSVLFLKKSEQSTSSANNALTKTYSCSVLAFCFKLLRSRIPFLESTTQV